MKDKGLDDGMEREKITRCVAVMLWWRRWGV